MERALYDILVRNEDDLPVDVQYSMTRTQAVEFMRSYARHGLR